jgi:hypothetical protein
MIHERNRASSPLQASLGREMIAIGRSPRITVGGCSCSSNGPMAKPIKRPCGPALPAPTRPGEILVSAPLGRLVEGWCKLMPREVLVGEVALDQIGVDRVVGVAPQ